MATQSKKTKRSGAKAAKKAGKSVKSTAAAKKKTRGILKKKPVKRAKRSIPMSDTQVEQFIQQVYGILDGSTRNTEFDKFLLGIFDPSNAGKAIQKSYFTVVITHHDPLQSKGVGIDINRIEMKEK